MKKIQFKIRTESYFNGKVKGSFWFKIKKDYKFSGVLIYLIYVDFQPTLMKEFESAIYSLFILGYKYKI